MGFSKNDKKRSILRCFFARLANEMRHLIHAWRTYVSFLELSDSIHGPAEYALRTVALQNNMVALHQNFDRIPLVHLVTFSQRFGQHNASQLIDFTDYSGRFHLFHLSCIYFLMITLRKLCFYYFDTIDEIPAEKCQSISFLSILFIYCLYVPGRNVRRVPLLAGNTRALTLSIWSD